MLSVTRIRSRKEQVMKISNAVYLSPNLRYDAVAQVVIVQRLNPETGEVTFQTPSRAAIREEEHAAVTGAHRSAFSPQPTGTANDPVSPAEAPKATDTESSHVSIVV
jgi:hypothetical protein